MFLCGLCVDPTGSTGRESLDTGDSRLATSFVTGTGALSSVFAIKARCARYKYLMQEAAPSRTAMGVAIRRAAHQLLDRPRRVLDDPLALLVIGEEVRSRLERAPEEQETRFSRALRAFVVARSRFAEDELTRAVERGVKQYVVLGAGLDTFGYRNPYPPSALRVFEVDHPATQAWKRTRLAAAGVAIPAALTFAAVDFERQTLVDGLSAAGFDPAAATFFSWLGVTMYLTTEAVRSVIELVASTPPAGGLVFDYAVPRASLSPLGRLAFDAVAERVKAAGEPFQATFDPGELRDQLFRAGFRVVEELGRDELNARYFRDRPDHLRVTGELGRIIAAER
jgi:methyltransferase (TIGR00027 family)